MEEERQTKIGVLKIVAITKGIKFEDSEDWFNPIDKKCKDMVLKEYVGHSVEIVLCDKNKFTSMVCLDKVQIEEDDLTNIDNKKDTGNTCTGQVVNNELVNHNIPKKDVTFGSAKVKKATTVINAECINDNELNIYQKLGAIQFELSVGKPNKNNFAKFNYRSASDILENLKPLIKKYDVSIIVSDEIQISEHSDRVYIKAKATFINNYDGSTISVFGFAREQDIKKGMDEAQITGSVSSYARKYALNGLFAIDDSVDVDSLNNGGTNGS